MNESLTLQPLCVLATTTGTDLGVLAGILDASSDACWCMEFTGPVDLTAPDHEVVRQVFLNDPRWRFCNAAMARLYLLPPDRVFDDQPVSDIFPRNRQNEEFVLNLISNGFEVDAAPALDRRYDGVQIYVENDVRAHIEDGRLIRMFGVVRDVGKHRHREEALKAERDVALAMLAAQPTAVLALGAQGAIVAANSAAVAMMAKGGAALNGQQIGPAVAGAFGAEAGRSIETAVRSLGAGLPQSGGFGGADGHSWSLCAGASAGPCVAVLVLTRELAHV
ncbi:MAG: hypothetical protein WAS26_12550 [Paracoccaceae bacterium]